VSRVPPPLLDPLTTESCIADAESRVPAFVPGWQPEPTGPGAALIQVYARFLKSLADRLNQAPDKNKMAFFDRLGIELLPAQPARAPVVFKPLQGMPDASIPARTRVGAAPTDGGAPLVFETEEGIALARASLAQIVSLWPGRDAWRDHTADLKAGRPFRLFDSLVPVPHVLYVAHDAALALAGASIVEVALELTTNAPASLRIVWEYWDGEIWREFKEDGESADFTSGLARSGVVRLTTDCGSSARTTVHGVTSRWIRARLDVPMPPTPDAAPAMIDRISLISVVDRSFTWSQWSGGRGIIPEQAFGGETKLDLTKSVTPLGARPEIGSALYLACDEAMKRPGAQVTLRYQRVRTPEEIADQQGVSLTAAAQGAEQLVIDTVKQIIDALVDLAQGVIETGIDPLPPGTTPNITGLTPQINTAINSLNTLRGQLQPGRMNLIADVRQAAVTLRNLLQSVPAGTEITFTWVDAVAAALSPGIAIANALFNFKNRNDTRFRNAASEMRQSTQDLVDALTELATMTPQAAALASGAQLPTMAAPVVAWEYWNGRRWVPLGATAAPTAPGSLTFTEFASSGAEITFTVPDDIEPSDYSGVTTRWIRARLTAGGYGIVTTVKWKDDQGHIHFYPIIQIRPPHIERLRLGYTWRSRPTPPERTFTENDFAFTDQSDAAITRGTPFAPFAPVRDLSPTLYLGFDAPLPADLVSLFLDIEETVGEDEGPTLEWEGWDGEAWVPVRERDDTRGLAVPGMVALPWPGSPPSADPLLARFGTALAWVRARRRSDGPPRRSLMRGAFLNAAWAAEIRSYDGETVGGGSGEPGQSFRVRNIPVLIGESLEVRELSGPRARVEEPILREELLQAGLSESDIRVVRDPRTNQTAEVWVRWRNPGSLQFGAPGDRIYEVERTRGRIRFGGMATGRAVPAGPDNVRVAGYRAGGGVRGNVGREKIDTILAGVLAERVGNPAPAQGGADSEDPSRVLDRGGTVIRNRRQAITASDYEEVAREASSAVAVARALPTMHPAGRAVAGWVTVRIVPQSAEPRPWASFELRDLVRRFIAARAPAAIARHIAVIPALYFPVGVDVILHPRHPSLSGRVVDAAKAELSRFLHPLTGGPEARGWPFGRDVYASDLCAALEAIEGLDYVDSLSLLVAGSPVGDHVAVPEDRIVVAGDLTVRLAGGDD
jgi:hypothetical protein